MLKKVNLKKIKNVYVICVGSELLDGTVKETNSYLLQKELEKYNLQIKNNVLVQDDKHNIVKFLKIFSAEGDNLIILIGGLGPTEDDLTRFALTEFTKKPLELNKKALTNLKEYFSKKNYILSPKQLVQAKLPLTSLSVKNKFGSADGIFMQYNHNFYLSLPGPPVEFKNVFENFICYNTKFSTPKIKTQKFIFNFFGIAESILEDKLKFCKELYTQNIMRAFLVRDNKIIIKIKIKGTKKEIHNTFHKIENYFKKILPEFYLGNGEEISLANLVVEKLTALKKTIAFSESLTGGLSSDLLTNVSGSSKIFLGGIIAYSNVAKNKILKVKKETLKKFGAVSEQTAKEMARGTLKLFQSDFAVSVTGIAGPTGGSKEKPVGLVYFGVVNKNKVFTEKQIFTGDRILIKTKATHYALYLIWKKLLEDW